MDCNICNVISLDGNHIEGVLYKDRYLVTRDGRIFTYKEKSGLWREQKARDHSNGYSRVVINRKDEYVHRIVAMCYLDNPRKCNEVNHKDGNKKNNNIDNLEWCTRSENNKHAFQTGLRSYEELSVIANSEKQHEAAKKRRKLTFEQAQEIRSYKGKTDRELAQLYCVTRSMIYNIRKFITYKYA